jgi:O-antigen ligase
MRRSVRSSIAIYTLLSATYLTVVGGVSRLLSFVVFAAVFAAILLWVWWDGSLTIAFHPTVLAGALLVWFALVVGFLGSPSASGFLRLGAFVGISGVLLFVLSNTFAPADVYRAVAWVGALLVVVALPTAVLGELGPLGIWRTNTLFDVQYFVPMSVFDNPNMLGAIAAMGGIGAVGELLSARTAVSNGRDTRVAVSEAVIAIALAGICALGVVLSTSRGALLTLVVGIGVCVFIHGFGRTVAAVATAFGGLVFLGTIAVAARLLPGPEVFQSIDLSGRGVLWHAVIQAVGERPLFGFGPGATEDTLAAFVPEDSRYRGSAPHSSYFRMFFIGGLVGGIGYLVLCLSALRTALADATPQGATTAAMVVAVFVILVFNGATLFGLHPVSVVGALTVGFAQRSSDKTRSFHVPRTLPHNEIESAIQQRVD